MEKADAAEVPGVFRRIGLLLNEPPGSAGLLFSQSSETGFAECVLRIGSVADVITVDREYKENVRNAKCANVGIRILRKRCFPWTGRACARAMSATSPLCS
jgi:hypothetical protein